MKAAVAAKMPKRCIGDEEQHQRPEIERQLQHGIELSFCRGHCVFGLAFP